MFEWLVEARVSVLVVLASAALVLLGFWWTTRQRRLLIAAGVAAGLLVVYLLLALIPTQRKTDRREIEERLRSMAAAANRADGVDDIMKYVDDDFRTRLGTDKAALRQRITPFVGHVETVAVDSIEFGDGPRRSAGTAAVRFRGWSGKVSFRCEAVFAYDAEHGWRLRDLRVFGPLPNEGEEHQL